jgi:hypothetical protein
MRMVVKEENWREFWAASSRAATQEKNMLERAFAEMRKPSEPHKDKK